MIAFVDGERLIAHSTTGASYERSARDWRTFGACC
jgi:hypothetical protein